MYTNKFSWKWLYSDKQLWYSGNVLSICKPLLQGILKFVRCVVILHTDIREKANEICISISPTEDDRQKPLTTYPLYILFKILYLQPINNVNVQVCDLPLHKNFPSVTYPYRFFHSTKVLPRSDLWYFVYSLRILSNCPIGGIALSLHSCFNLLLLTTHDKFMRLKCP